MFGVGFSNIIIHYFSEYLILFLLIIGSWAILKKILCFIYSFYSYFLRRELNLSKRYGGGYALVLGSTAGIGLQYCYEFAQRGFNLITVSRNLEKIEKRKSEILAKFPKTDIKVLEADLATI